MYGALCFLRPAVGSQMSSAIPQRPVTFDRVVESDTDSALLQRVEVFQTLGPEILDAVARRATRRTYAKGAHIVVPKRENRALCLVIAGALRVYRLSPQGQEITLAVVGAGRVYGLSFLSPGGPAPHDNLLQAVQEETTLFHVPQRVFAEIVDSHPCIALHALHAMGETLARLSNRVEDLGLHKVKTRLARTLICRVSAETSYVVMTHAELAAEVGARREEVSRALAELRRQRIVLESRRGVIVIADRLKLAHEANSAS